MGEKEPKAAHCTAAPTKTRTLKTSAKLWFGKSACGSVSAIYHLLASKTARVVEWQTRTFEGRMPKGMRVQVPPRARLLGTLSRQNGIAWLVYQARYSSLAAAALKKPPFLV